MVGWEDEFFIRAGVWSWVGPVIQKQHKTRSPALAAESKSAAVIFNSKYRHGLWICFKLHYNNTKMDLHQRWRAKVQKMKASAPEEGNTNGNFEALCHLENGQRWHWNFSSARGKNLHKEWRDLLSPIPPHLLPVCGGCLLGSPQSSFCSVSWWVVLKSEQKLVILAHDAAVYPKVSRCCRDTPDTVCLSTENMKPVVYNWSQ